MNACGNKETAETIDHGGNAEVTEETGSGGEISNIQQKGDSKLICEIDGKNKTIHLEDHIYIHDSIYCIARISIPSDEIKIREWLSKKDDIVEFLMNEYHSALGAENIKSKFLQVFAIIEFCEKEYEEHNESRRLLSDEEVDMVIAGTEKQFGSNKAIDKKLLADIIKLRNKSFHGTKENAEDVEKNMQM